VPAAEEHPERGHQVHRSRPPPRCQPKHLDGPADVGGGELPAQQWQAAVVDFGTPLSVFVAPDDPAGEVSQPARPVFDCSSTEALLAGSGLFCPPADGELLRRYLAAFVGTGYLPIPRKAG